MKLKVFITFLLCISMAYAGQTINHYALAKLKNPAIAQKITDRFSATGTPVFMIHNFKRGLSEGDFIRFKDKVVLIDFQVWQTLKADNALKSLEAIPVIQASGLSKSSDWSNRASQMKSSSWKKAYSLGSEVLKIFENSFTKPPKSDDIIVRFINGRATLIIPEQVLKSLQFKKVQAVSSKKVSGEITWAGFTSQKVFMKEATNWQLWAVDPREPSGNLTYKISGTKTPGLSWDDRSHSIKGIPTTEGDYLFNVSVRSSDKRTMTQACTLMVRKNTAPYWANVPDTIRVGPAIQAFPVYLSDKHHPGEDLAIVFSNLPSGFNYSTENNVLTWHPQDELDENHLTCIATVTDPLGLKTAYSIPVSVLPEGENLGYLIGQISPPWDTLTQGTTHSWNLAAEINHWKRSNLKFSVDSSSDNTSLTDDSILIINPQDDSVHIVGFAFKDRFGAAYTHQLAIPVRANRPPLFLTQPTDNDIDLFSAQVYEPKVYDPDGDSLVLSLESADSTFVFRNDSLIFKATEPGSFTATLLVTDPFGNTNRQEVHHFSQSVSSRWRGITLDGGIIPGYDSWGNIYTWRFMFESPSVRLGVFGPDGMNLGSLGDTTIVGTRTVFQLPFIFIGRQLSSPMKQAKGTFAAIDVGFSYNILSNEVQTIGFMFNGEFRTISKTFFNSEFDMRFLLYGRHMFLQIPVDKTYDPADTDGITVIDQQVGAHLLLEYIDPRNLNLILHATNWYHLGYGFAVGPSVEMRIAPLAQKYTVTAGVNPGGSIYWTVDRDLGSSIYLMMVGGGVKYHLKTNRFEMFHKVRMGYGGEVAGFRVFYDASLSFGRWKD